LEREADPVDRGADPLAGAADGPRAIRAVVTGTVGRAGEATRRRANDLGVFGWVRDAQDGSVTVHGEGPSPAIEALIAFLGERPRGAGAVEVALEDARVEGHEQFAIRGVSAGVFVVREHAATTRHFDLRLEVDGVMRSWALPKGPSVDPAVKRLAVQVDDHVLEHNAFEGRTEEGGVVIWDRGDYEQGGRVPWPEALDRGHAVFVLHGEKLHGGFALQRTGAAPDSQWLLVKRRDDDARPGSDVVSEHPASVLSGRTLDQILRDAPAD
jgi:DNA ligase D-like protein (predicted 3'-phosphoesterase)